MYLITYSEQVLDVLPPGPHRPHEVHDEHSDEHSQHTSIVSQAGHVAEHVTKVYGVLRDEEAGAYISADGVDWEAT